MKAVIFDLDGTIIDSTPIYLGAYVEIMERELGLRPQREKIAKQFGKSSRDIMKNVLLDLGLEPSEEEMNDIISKIGERYRKDIKKVIILPGAIELIDKLRRLDIKVGLTTSSRPYKYGNLLSDLGIEGLFDAIVTGEDVARAKPDPEGFLMCAKLLGEPIKETWVIEDSIYGIQAAKAAGMRVLAVCTGPFERKELNLENPDVISDNLDCFDYETLRRVI